MPFYYWTLNERFREVDEPDFNEAPDVQALDVDVRSHPLRLHRLRLNRREDASVFAAGRQYLPARNRPTVRQLVHRFDVGLPPVPEHMLQNIVQAGPDEGQ